MSISTPVRRLIVVPLDDQDEMTHRHIVTGAVSTPACAPPGRKRIAVIGIDRYRDWSPLHNAVRDGKGALRLFERLGFELVGQPLFDDAATGAAIQAFVTDDLIALGPDDSLVLFFAGHGGTRTQSLGGKHVKTGYLIPVDAQRDKASTWIDLEEWLHKVARLPPRHILVFVDACNAGIALSTPRWRDSGTFQTKSLAALQARRSRRIITSALDDQFARDDGPVPGHSLFTGCLIEGFEHGDITTRGDVVTGSEVGLYLQRRIRNYADSQQTPDFGPFDHDNRGEMVLPLPTELLEPGVPTERPSQTVSLAIATVTTSADGARERDATRRSRRRWIAAFSASLAIVLLSSSTFVSSFNAKPSSVNESSGRALALPSTGAAPPSDAANTDVVRTDRVATTQTAGDHGTGSMIATNSASRSAAPPVVKQAAPGGGNAKPSPATSSLAIEAIIVPKSSSRPPTAVGTRLDPSAAPVTNDPVDKQRVRAPPNRRLKPSVDERNCPVKGSQEVTIDSYPPGATLYINHKDCGALGTTPWQGKLPTSQGTATGKLKVIFERAGREPVTRDFTVLRSTRIQRLELRMP